MSKARNVTHRQDARDEEDNASPEDIAHQFLADAIHAGEPRRDTPRREASTGEEHTRTRRRLDLRGDAVREGSLFDDEGDELGETRAPEIDAEDTPHRVTRPRTPQR